MKKFAGAPWRDTSQGKDPGTEEDLLAALNSGRREIERTRRFLEADGLVASPLLQKSFDLRLFRRGAAAYPLEAYVAQAVRYLEALDKVERMQALYQLGEYCPVVKNLCDVALSKNPTPELIALTPYPSYTETKAAEGDEGHVYALGLELWKARRHTIAELLGGKGQAWVTGNPICVGPWFGPEDYACLRARLSKELPGLRDGTRALVVSQSLLPVLGSNPQWAQDVIQELVSAVLRTGIESAPVIVMVLDRCDRYNVLLPNQSIKRMLWACAEYRNDTFPTETFKLMKRCLGRAQDSALVASAAWDFLPEGAKEELIEYMPLARVEGMLNSKPTASVVRQLAQRKDISSDLSLAKLCASAAPGAVSLLLRNGSAEVQRYLIESGKYMDALVRVISKTPDVIQEGVHVPSPIVAKALSVASQAQKQDMLGHLGRWRG